MNEGKQRAGLYIFPSLHVQIGLFAHRHKWSWNQAATVLLERGLEAQPAEVADLVTAIRCYQAEHNNEDRARSMGANDFCVCSLCEIARAALAPFVEVAGE